MSRLLDWIDPFYVFVVLVAIAIVAFVTLAVLSSNEQEVTRIDDRCYAIVDHDNRVFGTDHTYRGLYCKEAR